MSEEMTDEQMDSLISGETESRGISQEPQKAEAQAVEEYLLKVNGKEVKANRDQVVEWAQMGYNYPQRAADLKKQQDDWQRQVQEKDGYFKKIEQEWSPYKQVDEFAKANPQWWNQVQESLKSKMGNAETPAEVSRIKQELMQELAPIKDFISQNKIKEESALRQKEDTELSTEIESLRKTYPNIDFATPDQEGKSLEMKVLEHAMKNDIKSFRAAFRDFYHDHLVSKAEEKGKETVSKQVQKQTKLGILGTTSKPTKGLQVASNVKSKSYNDLVQEALSEMNN